jgi:hypothetical protein
MAGFLNLLPVSKEVQAEGPENARGRFVHIKLYDFSARQMTR